jgi:hypothetical protein
MTPALSHSTFRTALLRSALNILGNLYAAYGCTSLDPPDPATVTTEQVHREAIALYSVIRGQPIGPGHKALITILHALEIQDDNDLLRALIQALQFTRQLSRERRSPFRLVAFEGGRLETWTA